MSKARKLALTIMSVLFALTFMLGLVACGGQSAEEAINAYLLPQDNALVEQDFTLPKKIGIDNGVEVTWKSDNAAITIEDGTADTYNAKVLMQDEVTTVKLTISSGGASKDFNVRVNALNVFTFMKWYGDDDYDEASFPQRKVAQKEDFPLDSTYTIQGKTATITWSVESAKDQNYLNVETVEGVQTAKVTPGDDVYAAKLKATFSYGTGDPVPTASKDFSISVSPELTHRQTVYKMYSEAGFPIEFDGYVVHVAQAEDSQKYGPMASIFAVDSDFCSGYYIWQAKLESAAEVAKVKVGAHFTFSGDFTKSYKGLWESNGYEEGTAVFDGVGDKTAEEMEAQIHALDIDLISGVESLQWQMSRLVSLTGWKVKTAWNSSSSTVVLENGSTTINVYASSYVATDAEVMTALTEKLSGLAVGDVVNIKGIFGTENAYRIQPRSAADVEKTTESAATNYDNAAKIKAAQEQVNAKVAEEFGSIIIQDELKTVEMPTAGTGTATDVKISYKLERAKTEGAATVIDGGTFTITSKTAEQKNLIEVTYTIGDYKAYSVFTVRSWQASDQDIVDEVYNALLTQRISAITEVGEYDLPTTELYDKATIEWTVVTKPAPGWASLDNGKLIVSYLPPQATPIKLKAHIVCTDAEKDLTFNVKVSALPETLVKAIETPVAGDTEYYLGMKANGVYYYATGSMSSYYFATSTDITKGVKVTLSGSTSDGWTLKAGAKYIEMKESSGHVNAVYSEQSNGTWKWDNTNKVFLWTISGASDSSKNGDYFLGNFDTNTSISTCAAKYIGEDYPARLVNVGTYTDKDKAQAVLDGIELSQTEFETQNEEFALPTYNPYGNNKVTWTITAGNSGNLVSFKDATNSTLKIDNLPNKDLVAVTLTATLKYGATDADALTKTFKIWLHNPVENAGTVGDPYEVWEAKVIAQRLASGAYTNAEVYVKGYVERIKDGWKGQNWQNVYIIDTNDATGNTTNGLQIYKLYPAKEGELAKGKLLSGDLSIKSTITVCGYLENYNGAPEMTFKDSSNPTITSYADTRTAAEKEQAALDDLKTTIPLAEGDALALKEDWTLPAPTVTGITFSVAETEDIDSVIEIEGTTVKVTRSTEGDKTAEVTVTATDSSASEAHKTKVINITVKKAVTAVATFEFGEVGSGGHKDGSEIKADKLATTTWDGGSDYTLKFDDGTVKAYSGAQDATGKSCIKCGTGSATATVKFTVSDDVKMVIVYIAGYKDKTCKVKVNGKEYDLTNYLSNQGKYLAIEVDTSTSKQVTIESSGSVNQFMIDKVEYYTET